jgi:hypothetical protein
MRPSPEDLHLLAEATRRPRQLARLAADAVVKGHDLDSEVRRDGPGYFVVMRVVAGERIVEESVWPVDWPALTEATRFGILRVYVAQILQGHKRWRQRMNGKLRLVKAAQIPSPSDE